MKSIRNIAFSVMLTLGAFTAVTYTACNKDECKDVVCNNGGTCISGACSCPTGFEGASCEIASRDKFLGPNGSPAVYTGNETCTIGTDSYSLTLTAHSDQMRLTMTNVYNQGFTGLCTMTGPNTFSFNGTGSGNTTFSGTGTLTGGNQLTVQYQISSTAAQNSCTFVGTK